MADFRREVRTLQSPQIHSLVKTRNSVGEKHSIERSTIFGSPSRPTIYQYPNSFFQTLYYFRQITEGRDKVKRTTTHTKSFVTIVRLKVVVGEMRLPVSSNVQVPSMRTRYGINKTSASEKLVIVSLSVSLWYPAVDDKSGTDKYSKLYCRYCS